jgi:cell division protein ZapE
MPTNSPSALYLKHCQDHNLTDDPAQQNCLKHFDRLWHEISINQSVSRPAWKRMFARNPAIPVPGIYLWGKVGRGKTMLMDSFYDSVNINNKRRLHFHHFMLQIHQSLNAIGHARDPLKIVARNVAGQIRLLCLDEFHVNDITDAMLLHGLLKALFAEKVTLVTTSNIEPDSLYAEGLQRARFLPAIELIKSHTQVLKLTGQTDYRLQTLRKDGTWHFPLHNSEYFMQNTFAALSSHTFWEEAGIDINGRTIPIRGQSEGTVWFDFQALCDSPRSQSDYIEIACRHHTVLLSGLPKLDDNHSDAARRLLNMLDIFYDHCVKLVVSADAPVYDIYSGKRLAFEFQRATSRLLEMQSEQYLKQPHRLQQ